MEYKIAHNIEEHQIEALIDSRKIGLIDYNQNNNTIYITHTEVDPTYEGQGIAGQMTKVILKYADDNSLKVVPICPYTKIYIDRHPEYQHLL